MEEGADFILGETYQQLEEALLATKCAKEYGKGTNILRICEQFYVQNLVELFISVKKYLQLFLVKTYKI